MWRHQYGWIFLIFHKYARQVFIVSDFTDTGTAETVVESILMKWTYPTEIFSVKIELFSFDFSHLFLVALGN